MVRLAVFATHPIQYQVPLWRLLASHPEVDLKVFFLSGGGAYETYDPGFTRRIAWDVPLLQGYRYALVGAAERPITRWMMLPGSMVRAAKREAPDYILMAGYTHGFEVQLRLLFGRLGTRLMMRGEFCDDGETRLYPKRTLRSAYLRWFYSKVDGFCVIGQAARSHLQRFGVEQTRMFWSPYCVDWDLFECQRALADREGVRRRLKLSGEHFVLLFSGKLIRRKRPLLLMRAVELSRERDRLAIMVVGDGPLREAVVSWGTHVLGERFVYVGFCNQGALGQYYAAADALVLPSDYEPWGLVVNEAMQFARPVIVSEGVACRYDLVEEKVTGLTFRIGDAQGLAAAIDQLAADRDASAAMGQVARERVSFYTPQHAVAGILGAMGLA